MQLLQGVTDFRGAALPAPATPAGYAALIGAFDLAVPLPYRLCGIGKHHRPRSNEEWRLFSPRYDPGPSVGGHLTFALKYEGVNLAVLSGLFSAMDPKDVVSLVAATPTGAYARRIWFLYEWLTGTRLNLPDLTRGNYVPVIDPEVQYALPGRLVSRQRVRDNLPGNRSFCPLVYRTEKLVQFEGQGLLHRARQVMDAVPRDIMNRAAAFLLLKDSRSSYAIEGESPPQNRAERWGRIIGEAGDRPLSLPELERLQSIVVADSPFVATGLRNHGGFVGEHDRDTGLPIPEHISARPDDLPALIDGLIELENTTAGKLPAVVAATVIAFGFVYIHPFSDGNGRIHRYLLHHVLARNGFGGPGLVFPVSAVILDRIETYRRVLQRYSRRTLELIEWEPTEDNNIQVVNETVDMYRYIDLTPQTEFIADCIETTVKEYLPRETQFLRNYDQFRAEVNAVVDMPDKTVNLLYRVLADNGGHLSRRHREKTFAVLTDDQTAAVENLFTAIFPDEALPPG
ncbi:MAG: Fic family protein [Alkalispirochaeta sp.]